MKKILSAVVMAFSTYTKIPMPALPDESAAHGYKNALAAFPLCAVPIAALYAVVLESSYYYNLPRLVPAVLITVLPVLITGGIHHDGYMDVKDAVNSYGSLEKKIEIMKDPHVGAFAVMSLNVYILLMTAVSYMTAMVYYRTDIWQRINMVCCASFIFFLGRCASGLCVLLMPKLRSEGMASEMGSSETDKFIDIRVRILSGLTIAGSLTMVLASYFLAKGVMMYLGLIVLLTMGIVVMLFVRFAMKEFSGINGDLAGYLLCRVELISIAVMTIVSFWFGGVY